LIGGGGVPEGFGPRRGSALKVRRGNLRLLEGVKQHDKDYHPSACRKRARWPNRENMGRMRDTITGKVRDMLGLRKKKELGKMPQHHFFAAPKNSDGGKKRPITIERPQSIRAQITLSIKPTQGPGVY